MSKKKVAIFGGTFDPPHLGHFILAEQLKNSFDLAEIIFMPAGRPPHKKDQKISPNKDRYQMLKLVTDQNQFFSLSDWEMKQEGYSYTAKTLREFVPKINAEKVFFIIGADSLAEIFDWNQPKYLLSEAHFIVFNRPGYDLKGILKRKCYQPYLKNITTYQGLNIGISSSFIRKEVRKNNSIRYLTAAEISQYIDGNNLYS